MRPDLSTCPFWDLSTEEEFAVSAEAMREDFEIGIFRIKFPIYNMEDDNDQSMTKANEII